MELVAVGRLGPSRGGQVVEQGVGIRRFVLQEGVEEVAHDGSSRTTAIAVPACTSTRSPTSTGATIVVSTVSTPAAVRTDAPPRSIDTDHLGGSAIICARRAHLPRVSRWRRFEQSRVLEADVRQLPQQVIQAHNRSVVPCRAGGDAIDPQDVIGRRRPAVARRRRSTPSSSPTPNTATAAAMPPSSLRHRSGRGHRHGWQWHATRRSGRAASIETAGRARLPTITGCTNSTATCRACSAHSGATHHIVAPAANRRARSRAHSGEVVGEAVVDRRRPAEGGRPLAARRASTSVPPTRCSGSQSILRSRLGGAIVAVRDTVARPWRYAGARALDV